MTYIGHADSVYGKLEAAPTDPTLYETSFFVFQEEVYVVRTREGNYAKIAIISRSGTLMYR